MPAEQPEESIFIISSVILEVEQEEMDGAFFFIASFTFHFKAKPVVTWYLIALSILTGSSVKEYFRGISDLMSFFSKSSMPEQKSSTWPFWGL